MLAIGDAVKQRALAEVMDELSGAICLQMPTNLLSLEVENFVFRSLTPQVVTKQPEDLAWTRAGFFVGEPTLQMDFLGDAIREEFQKFLDDSIHAMSVTHLAKTLRRDRSKDRVKFGVDETAAKINQEKVKPENLHSNFHGYFCSEVWGYLEAVQDTLAACMTRVIKTYAGELPSSLEEEEATGDGLRRMLGNMFKHGKIRTEIPQIHIGASLHAMTRLDSKRTVEGNDFEDFRHAKAALPYCDSFCTERSLAHLLTHKPLEFDQAYACTVLPTAKASLAYYQQLSSR